VGATMQNEKSCPASGNIHRGGNQADASVLAAGARLPGKRVADVGPAPLLMTRATKHRTTEHQARPGCFEKLRISCAASFLRDSFDMKAEDIDEEPAIPSEHPEPEEHGTSHLVKKQGVGGAVGTAVGTATGAAAGAVAGGFAGPAGMAIGALVGAGLGAAGGKAVGDPINPTLEEGVETEDKPRELPKTPPAPSGD
jgi:hypothetical protein